MFKSDDVSTETAKARLRELDMGCRVASWVEERPCMMLLAAGLAGGIAARLSRNTLHTLLEMMTVLLSEDDIPANDRAARTREHAANEP